MQCCRPSLVISTMRFSLLLALLTVCLSSATAELTDQDWVSVTRCRANCFTEFIKQPINNQKCVDSDVCYDVSIETLIICMKHILCFGVQPKFGFCIISRLKVYQMYQYFGYNMVDDITNQFMRYI